MSIFWRTFVKYCPEAWFLSGEFEVFEGWSTALLVRVERELMWREVNV